jgi:DNA-binding transcriptional MocR family regulator
VVSTRNPQTLRTAADIVADIEARIGSGQLAPGERLETVRTLAADLGVAANTVAAAYRVLGERGLATGEGRRGTFVAPRPPLGLAQDATIPAGIVDLSSGNPDPHLLPDLGTAFAELPTRPVLYGEPAMSGELLDHLAADLTADGIDATHLCIVGGALDGLERVLASHCRPGDRIGIEDPGYASVAELATAMALRPEPIAVDECGPLPESMAVAIGRGVRAVVVTPRAGNPTGAALDQARGAELRAALASTSDLLVIEDDHAGWVAGQPYVSVIPHGAERWAMVRSVAKSLGPDLRLAALAGDAASVARVVGRQSLGAGWVSHILQALVASLLGDPQLDRVLAAAAAGYAERRSVVVDTLSAAGIEAHGRSGLNVWVPVDDEAAVVAGMLRRGFAIRSGSRFRIDSPPGVRVSIGGADVTTLLSAAEALASLLAPRRPARSV